MTENGISGKQKKLIAALLSSSTLAEAAQTAGVGERTVYTWLNEPAFKRALRAAQDEAIDSAVSRLAGAATQWAGVLADIAQDEDEKGSTRVSAARAGLSAVLQLKEMRDLAERIEALEGRIGQ